MGSAAVKLFWPTYPREAYGSMLHGFQGYYVTSAEEHDAEDICIAIDQDELYGQQEH